MLVGCKILASICKISQWRKRTCLSRVTGHRDENRSYSERTNMRTHLHYLKSKVYIDK
jgi:hypothetical protein